MTFGISSISIILTDRRISMRKSQKEKGLDSLKS